MTSLRHTAILADNQTVSLHRSDILPTLFAILPDNQAVGRHSTKTIVMKSLTYKQLEEAPPLIKKIAFFWMANHPVGMSIYEKAILDHPEYFPEEVEYRRKWKSIPDSVHEEYRSEYWRVYREVFIDVPDSGSLSEAINNPSKHKAWELAYKIASDKFKPLDKAIHNKYYLKYGIKYEKQA